MMGEEKKNPAKQSSRTAIHLCTLTSLVAAILAECMIKSKEKILNLWFFMLHPASFRSFLIKGRIKNNVGAVVTLENA